MRRFGLIGQHLPHSHSEKYFAEKFLHEGITDCEYSNFEIPVVEALAHILITVDGLEGLNVTTPYKVSVMRYLDYISEEAQEIGSVNCIKVYEDMVTEGYNTDVIGLRDSMVDFLGDYRPEQALILGTGGASLAVEYVLCELDIPYIIVSRDEARGELTYPDITAELLATTPLIINATPLGTYPDVDSAPEIDYEGITPSHYLFDLVYNPPLTKFLAQGESRGAKICNGEAMLIGQAEAAWKIWNE